MNEKVFFFLVSPYLVILKCSELEISLVKDMNDVSGGSFFWPFFVLSFLKTLWRSQTASSWLLWKQCFGYIRNGSHCISGIVISFARIKGLTFSHVLQFVSEQSVIWHYRACLKRSRSVVITYHMEDMQRHWKCTLLEVLNIHVVTKPYTNPTTGAGYLPVELPADLDFFDSYFSRSETDKMNVVLEIKRLTVCCSTFWKIMKILF